MASTNTGGYRALARITGVIFAGREVFEGVIPEGTRIKSIEVQDDGAWLYFDDGDDLWVEGGVDGYVEPDEYSADDERPAMLAAGMEAVL